MLWILFLRLAYYNKNCCHPRRPCSSTVIRKPTYSSDAEKEKQRNDHQNLSSLWNDHFFSQMQYPLLEATTWKLAGTRFPTSYLGPIFTITFSSITAT